MCILRDSHTETGMATLIVIMIIVVMGVLLAGLIPLGTTVTHSAAYTRNALQAQYIAEAGAKRAIAALGAGSTDWNWLGSASWHDVVNNPSIRSRYAVSISGSTGPLSGTGAPADDTYTVTSSGQYGNFSKKVTVQVEVESGSWPSLSSSIIVGKDVETTGADQYIRSNAHVTFAGKVSEHIKYGGNLAGTNQAKFLHLDSSVTIPNINFSNYSTSNTTPLMIPSAASAHQTENLSNYTDKVYYHDGPLVYNDNSSTYTWQGPEASDEFAVVVVNGRLTLDASLNIKGHIIFLINGDFIQNVSCSYEHALIYCNNAFINSANKNFSVQLLVKENLKLDSDLNNSNPTTFDISKYLEENTGSGFIVSNWARGT